MRMAKTASRAMRAGKGRGLRRDAGLTMIELMVVVVILTLLAVVIVFSLIAHMVDSTKFQGPMYHLTSGAMMFGAFFIATDYVGAPVNPRGRLIFGAGVGLLVMVIRVFGTYPEGFMFAILVMNSLTPMIERLTTPTPFGGHVKA